MIPWTIGPSAIAPTSSGPTRNVAKKTSIQLACWAVRTSVATALIATQRAPSNVAQAGVPTRKATRNPGAGGSMEAEPAVTGNEAANVSVAPPTTR